MNTHLLLNFALCSFILLVSSCRLNSDNKISGPVKVQVVTYSESCQCYKNEVVTIETLTDINHVKGTSGGLYYNFNYSSYDFKLAYESAKSVDAYFEVIDGVYYPTDFTSSELISAYYHFEQVVKFFSEAGVSIPDLSELKIFFEPTQTGAYGYEKKDNASFVYVALNDKTTKYKFFMLYPFNTFQDIPIPMNLGVIAHEFSHYVLNQYLYNTLPKDLYKTLDGLDEGLADLFASLITGDSNFYVWTNPEAKLRRSVQEARTFEKVSELTNKLQTKVTASESIEDEELNKILKTLSNPYTVGNIIASNLWNTVDAVERPLLAKAIIDWFISLSEKPETLKKPFEAININVKILEIDAYYEESTKLKESKSYIEFYLKDILGSYIATLDKGLKTATCLQFKDTHGTLIKLIDQCKGI